MPGSGWPHVAARMRPASAANARFASPSIPSSGRGSKRSLRRRMPLSSSASLAFQFASRSINRTGRVARFATIATDTAWIFDHATRAARSPSSARRSPSSSSAVGTRLDQLRPREAGELDHAVLVEDRRRLLGHRRRAAARGGRRGGDLRGDTVLVDPAREPRALRLVQIRRLQRTPRGERRGRGIEIARELERAQRLAGRRRGVVRIDRLAQRDRRALALVLRESCGAKRRSVAASTSAAGAWSESSDQWRSASSCSPRCAAPRTAACIADAALAASPHAQAASQSASAMSSSRSRSHSPRSSSRAPCASPRSRIAIASSSTGFAEKRVICASIAG